MRQVILSTGIDIGTSTTQLIFSKITIENLANEYSVPRINIVDKEVVYRSDIYITPILNHIEIDADKVKHIVETEYENAGYKPKDLSTGAVIITGETARKANANEVLNVLSDMAGDFVVATAGPDLESVLAAKGAGTDKLSKENSAVIANIDVGGGTSNIAVYRHGNLIATSCVDVGGRLIKIEGGRITYIYEKVKRLAEDNGITIQVGDSADPSKLERICGLLAEQIGQALNLSQRTSDHKLFYTNDGEGIPESISIDGITFSGGVADCIYHEMGDEFRFDDIGILLGKAIRDNDALNSIERYQALETIRATVVGAGTHTTTVSGSTISYAQEKLPIKNLPVLKVSAEEERDWQSLSDVIAQKLPIYYSDGKIDQVAIALEGDQFSSFADIGRLAKAIIAGAKELIESQYPLIVILEKDIAKVLGNTLAIELGMKKEIICLDSIHVNDGDYLDIGEPLAQGNVVPIVTKTLIFNS